MHVVRFSAKHSYTFENIDVITMDEEAVKIKKKERTQEKSFRKNKEFQKIT